MSTSRSIRFACRLAAQAGLDDALVGDLLERHATAPSSGRLWRQVLGAAALKCGADLRQHKWLALRALMIGWILQIAFETAFTFIVVPACLVLGTCVGAGATGRLLRSC